MNQNNRKERVRASALSQLSSLVKTIFPYGKTQGNQFVIGDINGNKGDSLKIQLDGEKAGLWNDFASDQSGDVFDLIALHFKIDANKDFNDLLDKAESLLSINTPSESKTVVTGTWVYKTKEGNPWVKMQRIEKDGDKEFRPYDMITSAHKMPNPRPLYNLDGIIKANRILFVEGEKCAQALIDKGIPATTCMGGANTLTNKTNFKPLEGKHIIIWPDNDDAGLTYAQNITNACKDVGAIVLGTLKPPEGKPKGWDVADAINEGFDYVGHIESQNFTLSNQSLPPAKVKSGKFSFLHVSEIIDVIRPSAWLIKKYLEQHSMALIFGAPASGKSFIAIDMACSIATGTAYHGQKVTQGAVFYIAGEGTNNIRKRLKAWEVTKGISLSQYPLYVSSCPAQFYDETAAQEVEQAIETLSNNSGVKPALIVIDTLARNIGAGDENQTKDMNIFVNHVDAVKDKWQATALIVHHTGLQEQSRARGSSVLKAALDHEFHVVKENENIKITCTKMKDSKEPEPINFDMIEVKTGIIDDEGEEEASCILQKSWIDSFVKPVTGQPKKLLELIQNEMDLSGQLLSPNRKIQSVLCVKMDVLKNAFKASGIARSVKPDNIMKGFKRSIGSLRKFGFIDFTDDYIWLTDKPDKAGQTRNG